jgi:competence protein ComEA
MYTMNAPAAASAQSQPAQLWPHSAQLAAAFLVGLLSALLAVYAYSCRGGQPAELERGVVAAYRIDLNRASRAELLQLPGVGETAANRVDDYRSLHGGFRSVEELAKVRGVGPATLERLRPWVRVSAEPAPSTATSPRAPSGKKTDGLRVDINRASLEELQRLPGIGPKLSQRIDEARKKAPFQSVDELRRVSGIGPKTLERLRPFVIVQTVSERVAARDDS